MRLENYHPCMYTGKDLPKSIVPAEGDYYMLAGFVSGHPKFPDGSFVVTSTIVSNDGKVAKTHSGSIYELGTPHPDYQEMKDVVSSGEIPVLENWNFDGSVSISNRKFSGEANGKRVTGTVVAQEGNFVEFSDGRKFFVNWSDPSRIGTTQLVLLGPAFGVEKFMGMKCRINLLAE